MRLDDVLDGSESVIAGGSDVAGGASLEDASSWGAHGDLSTWSGPAVAELAFAARAAELATSAGGPHRGRWFGIRA